MGTAYQSLFDYVWAKKNGGQFVLRLEDTDRTRLVEGAAENIYEMLRWVGLPFDEGPDIGGSFAPYVQSERLESYHKQAEELVANGHAYYCFCTAERLAEMRLEQQKNHQPPKYDRHCLSLTADEVTKKLKDGVPHVIRMKVPEGQTSFVDRIRGEIVFNNHEVDDQVLLKSDGFPTYHLAVVVDDHSMGITDVIRGEEWISSTPKHILLYQFFDWPLPTFTHLPLLLNADKSKLSKRKNDVSILSYKEQGVLPEALINFLAQLAWTHPEGKDIYSLDEMMELFTWERVQKTGAIFGMDKMRWFNGQYIRALSDEELALRLRDYTSLVYEDILRVVPLIKDRLVVLSEFDDLVAFVFEELPYEKELLIAKSQSEESTRMALSEIAAALAELDDWSQEPWEKTIRDVAEKLGWKAGDLFMAIRVAITYSKTSPPLRESMEAVGREQSLQRIQAASQRLSK